MIGFLLRWSMNLLALMVAASLIDGIKIKTIGMGILAAGILGVVNAIIRPVVLLLTLPINILTLGLFTLVINAFHAQDRRGPGARIHHRNISRGILGGAGDQPRQLASQHLHRRGRQDGPYQFDPEGRGRTGMTDYRLQTTDNRQTKHIADRTFSSLLSDGLSSELSLFRGSL